MTGRIEQIFSERSARWSGRVAIEIDDRHVTYRELDEVSNRLARRLIQEGVGRNGIVAVATGNIEYFAVAVLAILKAGAAYLAVDTRYPVERVYDILTDASPSILLAERDFPDKLVPPGLPVIHDFAANTSLSVYSPVSIEQPGTADETACIFYTSGSTGRPKGVEVAHRGIPGLVGDPAFVPFGPNDRVGQAATLAFDAISFELWGAVLNGACLIPMPAKVLFSTSNLAAFLKRQRITVIFLTTSLFNAHASRDPKIFGTLKTLVIGGEAADGAVVEQVLRSDTPPARLINGYGPTEATTFATWHNVTLADIDSGRVPIGKALQDRRIYILDERLAAVPRGAPGELFIGGPAVANGYLRQPTLTKERFVTPPYNIEPSGRLYRTGDQGRALADGTIEYLGRIDDQVKIRGFRVEPAEVAAIMRKLSGVEDAVVLARPASFGTSELIAFVRGENLPATQHLRSTMAKLVPDYMMPSIIRAITAFPLSATGKLDRRRLLEEARSEMPKEDIDKRPNAIERQVTEIWKGILTRDDLAADRDFYELGGDSLSVMKLALEIEAVFGIFLSAEDLTPPLTIVRLAYQVRTALDDKTIRQGEHAASPKVFAIAYPWIMGRLPGDEVGQALGGGQWQHLHVPISYFLSDNAITIEGMASYLERLICSRTAQGPYVLYGQCMTGLLAYEVARRLTAAGRLVSLVVILDSFPAVERTRSKQILSFAWRAVTLNLHLRSKISEFVRKVRLEPANKLQEYIHGSCWRAVELYRPLPYEGRVIFFRHQHEASLANHDLTVWRKLVRGEFTEHVINMHENDRVTDGSVQSGYRELVAKLKAMKLVESTQV